MTTLAFALALVAGCLDDSATGADAADGPASPPALAAFTTVIEPAGGVSEPSLGVEPDGTLWTTGRAPVAADRGYRLVAYRSADDGHTWQMVDAGFRHSDLDPDLAVSRDGTVWLDSLWVGCTSAASSRDSGATWTMSPLACVPLAGDRQYLVPTEGGTAYIASHQRPMYQQAVAKTTDYGATWVPLGFAEPTPPVHFRFANEGSGWGGGGFWNAARDSVWFSYTWFEVDATGVETGWAPAASVSRDGGETWEVVKAPMAGGDFIGLSLVVGAADSAGNVYLAWAESHDDGADIAIYLSSSTDDGRSWSPPQRVDDGAGSKVWPAIAAGSPGKVAVAYYETSIEGDPATMGAEASWNVTLAWTADALADEPTFSQDTLSAGPVKRGAMCPYGFSCQSDDELRDYFALKALPDGRVASVWTSMEDVPGEIVNLYGSTALPLLGPDLPAT